MNESQELIEEQAYTWLEMHKKSALSYVVLSALQEKEMWSKDLVDWITQKTSWSITEKGLYRLLRRMQSQGSIEFSSKSVAKTGAERKVFRLTPEGKELLALMQKELTYLTNLK